MNTINPGHRRDKTPVTTGNDEAAQFADAVNSAFSSPAKSSSAPLPIPADDEVDAQEWLRRHAKDLAEFKIDGEDDSHTLVRLPEVEVERAKVQQNAIALRVSPTTYRAAEAAVANINNNNGVIIVNKKPLNANSTAVNTNGKRALVRSNGGKKDGPVELRLRAKDFIMNDPVTVSQINRIADTYALDVSVVGDIRFTIEELADKYNLSLGEAADALVTFNKVRPGQFMGSKRMDITRIPSLIEDFNLESRVIPSTVQDRLATGLVVAHEAFVPLFLRSFVQTAGDTEEGADALHLALSSISETIEKQLPIISLALENSSMVKSKASVGSDEEAPTGRTAKMTATEMSALLLNNWLKDITDGSSLQDLDTAVLDINATSMDRLKRLMGLENAKS
ncbi:MAG: hypothetical protein O3C63_03900 [Cyanobacteria bacterium]|nr:hypothetical protein [Cyanobacteriota bacterium]